MRAPDGSEGRKAKCPGCQKLVTITAARPEEPEEPPAPPPSRRRRDEEEEAPSRRGVQEGRSRRRDEDEEDEEERRSPAARRRRGEDEEDDRPSRRRRDEDDRPSRRRRDEEEDEDERPSRRRPRFSRGHDPGQTGMSMTSMILGIVSVPATFCCWPIGVPVAILAIIFGIIGMPKGGKGMGLAGLILGGISLLLLILVLALNIGMRTASNTW
jgi:hypothetical protein